MFGGGATSRRDGENDHPSDEHPGSHSHVFFLVGSSARARDPPFLGEPESSSVGFNPPASVHGWFDVCPRATALPFLALLSQRCGNPTYLG